MRKLLGLLLLLLIGLGAGVGVGWWLRPPLPPAPSASPDGAPEAAGQAQLAHTERLPGTPLGEVQRLPSQFIIPIIAEGRVRALMSLSLAIAIAPGQSLDLLREEARLRAVLLQVLFDHANAGGFDGNFTDGERIFRLRSNLTDAARAEFGAPIQSIAIVDLARQEMQQAP